MFSISLTPGWKSDLRNIIAFVQGTPIHVSKDDFAIKKIVWRVL